MEGLGGLLNSHPFVATLFAVPALSLAGIPPLSGFWAKLGLFQASFSSGHYLVIGVMVLGGFLTVYSMTKIWLGAFWGKQPRETLELRPASTTSLVACALLSILTVAVGLFPDFLFAAAEQAAQYLLERRLDG